VKRMRGRIWLGLALFMPLPPAAAQTGLASFDQAEVDRRDEAAQALVREGRYDAAEALFRENLAIVERGAGPDHPDALIARNNLGTVLLYQGRAREAVPLLEAAVAGLERVRGADDQDLLASMGVLGNALQLTGRVPEAERLLRRVATSRERLLGPDDARTLLALNNLAVLLRGSGRPSEAEPLLRRIIETRRRAAGPDDRQALNTEVNLTELLVAAGRHDEAETMAQAVLERAERRNGDPEMLVNALNGLAMLYFAQGRGGDAEPILVRGLAASEAAFGAEHPSTLLAVNNLASVYNLSERYAEAAPLLERVLRASEARLGAEHRLTLGAADNLALAYSFAGRYGEAEALFGRTEAKRARTLSADDPERYASVHGLAAMQLGQRRFAESEVTVAALAAEYARILGEENARTIELTDNLAMARLFQPERAAEALAPARILVAHARARRGGDSSARAERRRQQVRTTQADWFHYLAEAAWARAAAQPGDATALPEEAFAALQDGVAGDASEAIARMAARREAAQAGRGLAALVREREELNQNWSANAERYEQSFEGLGSAEADSERAALTSARQEIESRMAALDARLRREFPDYFTLVRPDPLTIAETQALLRPDEALLLIVPGTFATHTIALSREAAHWHRFEEGETVVERAVQRLRWNVGAQVVAPAERLAELEEQERDRSERSFNRTTAHNLYRELIAPGEDVLRGKRRVFVVAGGSLAGLPFSLLVTAPPQGADDDPVALRATPWFADAHALVHIPALQSLAALRRAPPSRRRATGFAGFGDPVLAGQAQARGLAANRSAETDIEAMRNLARLPGTAIELERMRVSLGASAQTLFTGARATETQLRATDLRNVRVIAFATHGLIAGEAGMSEPGLVLTPPETPSADDDGYLAASEVATLRLNADWVILSACNTATGDSGAADGLGSLARAFFYAGARGLLASHWPVSDAVAPIVTVRALELEQSGMAQAEAFQQAMRDIRNDPRADAGVSWAHPFFWAPFVLIGDGG